MKEKISSLWNRATGPIKVGLSFGLLAALLAIIGWCRERGGDLLSLLIAVSISFATWGVVSWAIAQAAHEVEREEEG